MGRSARTKTIWFLLLFVFFALPLEAAIEVCPKCGKSMPDSEFDSHYASCKGNSGSTPRYPCSYCGEMFYTSDAMGRHMASCSAKPKTNPKTLSGSGTGIYSMPPTPPASEDPAEANVDPKKAIDKRAGSGTSPAAPPAAYAPPPPPPPPPPNEIFMRNIESSDGASPLLCDVSSEGGAPSVLGAGDPALFGESFERLRDELKRRYDLRLRDWGLGGTDGENAPLPAGGDGLGLEFSDFWRMAPY